jgi:putative transposase
MAEHNTGCRSPLRASAKGAGVPVLRNKLERRYGQHDLHFLTFSCYRRLPLLGSVRARNTFVKILGELRETYGFQLVGYVVMPEHVHLLLSEPKMGTPSLVMQVLKQRVSRTLRKRKRPSRPGQLALPFSEPTDALPHFWQRRFYDFNVWSWGKRKEKLEYMHRNPLTRKLVTHPKNWPWSSWSFYEKGEKGLVGIDLVD